MRLHLGFVHVMQVVGEHQRQPRFGGEPEELFVERALFGKSVGGSYVTRYAVGDNCLKFAAVSGIGTSSMNSSTDDVSTPEIASEP